tara:strand:- start:1323 stop:1658 length:336 start_codon:yes stop_codon:yes gene_type:complete
MPRYKRTKIFTNDEEYYNFLTKNRNIKKATHYATPILRNPTITDRTLLLTTAHIWSYGDRFYNLAFKFYGDPSYWWVIAWYNGVPTEADIQNGDLIDIPVNLNDALSVLGV